MQTADTFLPLRSVDLNLLVFFDALFTERHVTRAAARIAVSQPAMSNALARLRHVFKDELFIRSPNGMQPTPRALELAAPIQALLRQAKGLMTSDLAFDPSSSDRLFTCRMSDLVGSLLLPQLTARLQAEAPRVAIEVLHLPPEETIAALEGERLDLALSMHLGTRPGILSEPLLADRMVCLMRKEHPAAVGPLTLRRFLAPGHVRVAMSPTDIRFVDNVLASRGLRRRVSLTVPHWLLLPGILAASDLIAVMSERAARALAAPSLAIRALPFKTEDFSWTMYWPRRHEAVPAHRWLRAQMRAVAAAG